MNDTNQFLWSFYEISTNFTKFSMLSIYETLKNRILKTNKISRSKFFKFRPGQIALIFPFVTFLKLFHANVNILYRHWIYSIIINQYSQL